MAGLTLPGAAEMRRKHETVRSRLQHHILNYILISRYQLVANGFPKPITVKYLLKLEHMLVRLNIISH